jgi:signal transduction histidine kinase
LLRANIFSRDNSFLRGKSFSRPIWVRFTLVFTAIFTLSMMLVLVLTLVIGKNHLTDQIRAQIQTEIQLLQYEFREDGLAELLEETEERIEKNPLDRRLQYTVQNARGEVLFDDFPTSREQLGWQSRQLERDSKTSHYLFYYQALDGDHLLGIGSSLASVEQFQAAIGKAFLLTLSISLAIGIASGFGVGVWISRRLRIVLQALRQVAAGKWQTRLAEDVGGYEFEQLATELNRMFAQLEQSIANLKYISAGISHDLRTPITRLRNRLAALQTSEVNRISLQGELEQAQQELDGLLSYFDSALLINELQSGELARNFEVLDFSDLLENMLDHYVPLLEDAGLTLSADLQKPLPVRGMASLLQRLIANLLDNVLIHGFVGTHLSVVLNTDADHACLTFTNSLNSAEAPATQPYQLPAGIERKKMGQKIIAAITAAHGGSCVITRDAQSHQSRIQIPLA